MAPLKSVLSCVRACEDWKRWLYKVVSRDASAGCFRPNFVQPRLKSERTLKARIDSHNFTPNMLDIVRDSTFGQLARLLLPTATSAGLFSYPEERPNYVLPSQYRATTAESDRSETATIVERDVDAQLPPTQKYHKQRPIVEEGAEGWAGEEKSELTSVDWYDEHDPENPQ
jgi:hypothetical protein